MNGLLLSIPSPSTPYLFRVGGFEPRWYGLLLAVGVLVGGWMTRREFVRRSVDPDLVYPIAVWGVPFGLVGARLYHVVTDWGAFWPHNLGALPSIWQGGLGIWGAVLGGMLGVWIGARRAGPFWMVADSIAPGLILAQAIGRWGNHANSGAVRPPLDPAMGGADQPRASLCALPDVRDVPADVPLRVDLGRVHVPGAALVHRRYWRDVPWSTIFALYVVLYDLIRLPLETMKIDPADRFFGQRINVWVAASTLIAALIWFGVCWSRRRLGLHRRLTLQRLHRDHLFRHHR